MRLKDEPDAAALAGIMATSYCEADSQPQLAQFLVGPGGPVNPATRQIAPLSRKMLDGGLRTRNRSALLATPPRQWLPPGRIGRRIQPAGRFNHFNRCRPQGARRYG